MSDFADPDPATAPPESEGDVSILPEKGEALDLIDDDVQCPNCAHFNVCGIYKAIMPMMTGWPQYDEDDTPPVNPNHLAIICGMFELDDVLEVE